MDLQVTDGMRRNQTATQAPEPTVTTTAVAEVAETVTVPGVVGLTLDKATDQLEDLGFEVESVDNLDGKTIIMKKNWQVMSQDGAEGIGPGSKRL
ncbi:UNVERIFIED_ORG: beta-lactam-binding protein with PASTA domain [Arthrobacter globiformis]|nr:beta-lactam-binding protein with PASTA domain [Arthrobacter globiformis]